MVNKALFLGGTLGGGWLNSHNNSSSIFCGDQPMKLLPRKSKDQI